MNDGQQVCRDVDFEGNYLDNDKDSVYFTTEIQRTLSKSGKAV